MLLKALALLLFKTENKKELYEEVNKFQWSALRCYLNDNIPILCNASTHWPILSYNFFLPNSVS